MKIIRINDDLHNKLKLRADAEKRTINAQAELFLEPLLEQLPETGGTPKIETPKSSGISGSQYDSYEKKSEPEARVDIAGIWAGAEKPCCANENKPCQHWVWDASTGEGYRNSLSGRFREAE